MNMESKLSVTMVTRNKYKIESMKKVLEPYGINLDVMEFEVPEIQGKTCEEVAQFSAKYAADHCGKPVIKADSGIFIEALNDMPGVYTSQFQKELGVDKVVKMMAGEKNRKARIVYALAYCEPSGEPIVFIGGSAGTIAETQRGKEGMLIDFLFIPKGSDKTLGELREIDPKKRDEAWGDAEKQFAEWFINRKR